MLLLFPGQQDGGLFPTQGSYSQERRCSETSAGPCVQKENSSPSSPQPGRQNPQRHWTEKNREISQQEGCRARAAGEGGTATTRAGHRAQSAQSQMPHRVSGKTFVFCGLFFPSHSPNVFCAKCSFLVSCTMSLLITRAEQLASQSPWCTSHNATFTGPNSCLASPSPGTLAL